MKKAIILLSGGMDSTTCLAIAKTQGFTCYALSFSYGQKSGVEVAAAKRIAEVMEVQQHVVIPIDIGQFGGSALTDSAIAVPAEKNADGIPITYVPARNTVFLSIALSWAEVLGGQDVFFGATKADYESYPDCRPEYLASFEKMANLATKVGVEQVASFKIHTPLLQMNKPDIVLEGQRLGIDHSLTCSCYHADAEGRACHVCQSCQLRKEGFEKAGIADPTRYILEQQR